MQCLELPVPLTVMKKCDYFVFPEGRECAQLRLDNLLSIGAPHLSIPGINQYLSCSWTACLFQLFLRNINVYEPVLLCVVVLRWNSSGLSEFVWSLSKIEKRVEINMVAFWPVILNFPEITCMLSQKREYLLFESHFQ